MSGLNQIVSNLPNYLIFSSSFAKKEDNTPDISHPQSGVQKIFFVWYPEFFETNFSYEVRDSKDLKMRQNDVNYTKNCYNFS